MTDIKHLTIYECGGEDRVRDVLLELTDSDALSEHFIRTKGDELKELVLESLRGKFSEEEIESFRRVISYMSSEDYLLELEVGLVAICDLNYLLEEHEEDYEDDEC